MLTYRDARGEACLDPGAFTVRIAPHAGGGTTVRGELLDPEGCARLTLAGTGSTVPDGSTRRHGPPPAGSPDGAASGPVMSGFSEAVQMMQPARAPR